MSMWIGALGALREITDGTTEFDRSPDLGVTEFRALGGGVTTWVPPISSRRLSLSWESMELGDVHHLDRLARRVDGPGPVYVIDPASENWLSASHASARVSVADYAEWSRDPAVIFPANLPEYSPIRVSVPATASSMRLMYKRPDGSGYPVAPGMRVSFWVPGMVGVASDFRIYTYPAPGSPGATGSFGSGAARTNQPFTLTIPDGVATIVPVMWFNKLFADLPLSGAWLREARPEDATMRTSLRQALPTRVQTGTGVVGDFTTNGPVTLTVAGGKTMVQSTGGLLYFGTATTYPITPGEIASLTHAVPGATSSGLVFTDTAGTIVGQVRGTLIGRAPEGAAYVWPRIEVGQVATATALGAASLEITGSAPPVAPGQGTRPYSVTGYRQVPVPGSVDVRDVSLDLVEVR